jgi:hypothetical protein
MNYVCETDITEHEDDVVIFAVKGLDMSDRRKITTDNTPHRPAIRSVLIRRSSYFRKYFQRNPNDTIVCMDISDISLRTFIRMIYAAEILIHPDHVSDLLIDSAKYEFNDISFAIGSLMSFGNVFQIREQAAAIGDAVVTDMADQFVDKNFSRFFKRDNFVLLPDSGVKAIISDQRVSVAESLVWHLCDEWAAVRKEGTSKSDRSLMLPFYKEIRFPLLTLAQLTDGPLSSMILTQSEVRDVMRCIVRGERSTLFYDFPRDAQRWEDMRTSKKRKRIYPAAYYRKKKSNSISSTPSPIGRYGPIPRPGKNARRDNY